MGEAFKVKDLAVYPGHGVGQIERLEEREIAGNRMRFFILRILKSEMTVMIPVDNVVTVGLRKVIDSAQVNRVFKILKEREISVDTQTWNRRYREYSDKIKTGSVFQIAEVLRDLCIMKIEKDLSFGERKMLDEARSLLVHELAIAKKKAEADILGEVDKILEKTAQRASTEGVKRPAKAKIPIQQTRARRTVHAAQA
ncbi:MAG: CarD family transcriptional regulator [Deltaproteobacteria bacterium]|nr:CarD family transcriptional regulator [Deltaproteobacteria bacterium]